MSILKWNRGDGAGQFSNLYLHDPVMSFASAWVRIGVDAPCGRPRLVCVFSGLSGRHSGGHAAQSSKCSFRTTGVEYPGNALQIGLRLARQLTRRDSRRMRSVKNGLDGGSGFMVWLPLLAVG